MVEGKMMKSKIILLQEKTFFLNCKEAIGCILCEKYNNSNDEFSPESIRNFSC